MKASILCLMILTLSGLASVQDSQPQSSLIRHTLVGTFFDVNAAGTRVSCSGAGCEATSAIFQEQIECPALAGKKCTYQVMIGATNILSPTGDDDLGLGLYQFLVDDAAPNPGPTDSNGFYAWQRGGLSFLFGTSVAVTATVANTSANQHHSVVVNLVCIETKGDVEGGCEAYSNSANLQIAVYKP